MSRLGLVCSGGGAVFATAHDLLARSGDRLDWAVLTDRACGAEAAAAARGLAVARIPYTTADAFSADAARWLFDDMRCDWTILLITRLVGPQLYAHMPCVNIHPSLLPAFPGLGSLPATQASGVRVMGATAHLVDASTDSGPILGQVWGPTPPDSALIQRVSFAQKTYLFLVLLETVARADPVSALRSMRNLGASHAPIASPALQDGELDQAFRDFLKDQGVPWPI